MPLPENVEVTDNLVIVFRSMQKTTFEVAIVNNDSKPIMLHSIASSLEEIKSNINQECIESGVKKVFVFEVNYISPTKSDSAMIRFKFGSRNVVRSIQIKHDYTIKNDGSNWVEEFKGKYPLKIEISDNLCIEFDRLPGEKKLDVSIRNNSPKPQKLTSVTVNNPAIKLLEDIGNGILIAPRSQTKITIIAKLLSTYAKYAVITFKFDSIRAIHRTLHISKSNDFFGEYDAPEELFDLIYNSTISRSHRITSLNKWVPSIEEDYGKHFHNLLFIEEISFARDIKKKYNQNEAFFGDNNYTMKNGVTKSEKYDHGIYDLEVSELFEIRPSLQIGDEIIARKHSNSDIAYKGRIMELKIGDVIVIQFGEDFVTTFDYKAYYVDFVLSRSHCIQQHKAIESSIEVFGLDFLMPNKFEWREKCQIDVELNENMDLVMRPSGQILEWFNSSLNSHQKRAVRNVLRHEYKNPYILHGPPGTGKTTTLIEMICQTLKTVNDGKLLVVTQSNSAANVMVQYLIKRDQWDCSSMIRIISKSYFNKSNLIPEDIRPFCKTFDDLKENDNSKFIRSLEKLMSFRVVVITSSALSKLIEIKHVRNIFTHAFVDEAGQCTEMDVLIPMVLMGKDGQTTLAGDPMQMPPLVFNEYAQQNGLSIPMLSRLMDCYATIENLAKTQNDPHIACLISKLIHSYRSLPSIVKCYNELFYDSILIPMIPSHGNYEANLLQHLSTIFSQGECEYGIRFINVDGRNWKRKVSWYNIEESNVIKSLVSKLTTKGLNENDIGVISPYSMQVRALECCLKQYPHKKVGSVEDLQGLERKVILISTVRSCPTGSIIDAERKLGFVKCPKRINVAISRARILVILVGKAELLSVDENWKVIIEGCKTNGTFSDASTLL